MTNINGPFLQHLKAESYMDEYSQFTTDFNRVWCLHVVFANEYQDFNQNNISLTLLDVGFTEVTAMDSGIFGKLCIFGGCVIKLSTFQNSLCIAIATLA